MMKGRFMCDRCTVWDGIKIGPGTMADYEEVGTIARVVVVPRFRGIGLGVALVRQALARAETRYVEALAVMGRVQPFFEKAGMRRYERPVGPEAVRVLAAVEAVRGELGNR